MIAAYPRRSDFEGFALRCGDARQRQLQAFTRQDQVSHGLHVQAVELAGEVHQRSITALTHGLDDVEHPLVDRVVGHAFPAQQMIQMMGEIRVGSVESGNCSGRGHSEGLNRIGKNSGALN